MTTLNDAFETDLAQEDNGYESRSENFNTPTPLSRILRIYHGSAREDFSFNPSHFGESPTTPMQHEETSSCQYRCCSFTCHQLVFTSSNDESPVRPQHSITDARSPVTRRAELSSSVHQNLNNLITHTPKPDLFLTDAWDDDTTFSEENIPTAPLDDEVWSEDPIPDRHLSIHERPCEPNLKSSYPCPYSTTTVRMDLLQSTPQSATVLNYEQMDFSDISSDFLEIMMTKSDNDIPDHVDISKCLDNMQHEA